MWGSWDRVPCSWLRLFGTLCSKNRCLPLRCWGASIALLQARPCGAAAYGPLLPLPLHASAAMDDPRPCVCVLPPHSNACCTCTPLHCAQGVGYGLSVAAFFVYQQIKMRQLAGESSAKHGGGGSLSASIAANSSSRMVSSGDLPRYQAVPTAEARAGNIPTTPQTGRD